jgi:ABC-type sugar transport system substrate-binding protein
MKAAQDFGVKTYMQAPATADEAEQARLIQDAISRGVDAAGADLLVAGSAIFDHDDGVTAAVKHLQAAIVKGDAE